MREFKTCGCCGIAFPLHVAWDINLCWACGHMIWRGAVYVGVSRWRYVKWRAALRLYLFARRMLRVPEDALYD